MKSEPPSIHMGGGFMFNEKRFASLYQDKTISIKQISEEFGISPRSVYTKAKRLNLNIRSEKKYEVPLEGQQFNRLTFIKEEGGTGNRKYWLCSCQCGTVKLFPYWGVFSGKTISCGCYQREKAGKIKWKGFGDISGRYWSGLKDGAKRRGIEFSLTIEEAWDVYLCQNRKCALSGTEIEFSRMTNKCPQTASLDRIDNSKGYITGNIQWLHKMVNSMKHCMEQEYFVNFCCRIAENSRPEKGD